MHVALHETKEEFNARIQERWDQLMREGKHGHYETLFRLCREVAADEREACADLIHDRLGADGYGVAEMIRSVGKPG